MTDCETNESTDPKQPETTDIKEGDIFRWSYKVLPWSGAAYHCRSQIAIARDERLIDTYWGLNVGGACWTFEEARAKLYLTFVANLADLEPARDNDEVYYEESDLVDLRHKNDSSHGSFFRRKGAKRSKEKMLAYVSSQIEKARGRATLALADEERFSELYLSIQAAVSLDEVYL